MISTRESRVKTGGMVDLLAPEPDNWLEIADDPPTTPG